jgi:hypothetical protein
MGNLLHGKFELRITSIRNRGKHTDRYKAVIISTGQEVSVKFVNHDTDPYVFVGKTAFFDGNANDIQDNPHMYINPERDGRDPNTFVNPFENQ